MRSFSTEFTSYHSKHSHPLNKALHIFGIPLIQLSTLILVAYPTSPLLIPLSALTYTAHHTALSPLAAALCLPYIALIHTLAFSACNTLLASPHPAPLLAALALLKAACWCAQLYGHYVLEGNSPAVAESVVGPLLSAPLFVVLEVFWAAGFQGLKDIGATPKSR